MRAALAALAAFAALAGCAGSAGPAEPFSALALDPRLLAGDVPQADTITRGVEARVVSRLIVWVPTSGQPPTLAEAVAEALGRGHGDVLVNATVHRVAWYVPLLYGEYGWVVRGDVVRLRDRRPHLFDRPEGAAGRATPRERPASEPPGP